MQRRAEQVFKIVNEKISLGAGNVYKIPESKKSLTQRERIEDYYRTLYMHIMTPLKDIDPKEFNLYMVFLLALFAEIYKTGKCGEYTFLSIVEFLVQGKEKNLSIICIDDNSKDTNHGLLFLNLPLTAELENTSTYINFLLYDSWPGNAKIKKYDHEAKFNVSDLKNSETPNIDKFSIFANFPGILPLADWLKISSFFSLQRKNLTKHAIKTSIDDNKVTGMKTEIELEKLNHYFFISAQKYGAISEKHRKLTKFPRAHKLRRQSDTVEDTEKLKCKS